MRTNCKRLSLFLALCCALLAACNSAPASQEVSNPLTYTDIPDNDVIRVGKDYYMVSTTMYFCPGAPIMHSRDLVHWRIVNYIYDVLADDDNYNLRNGRNAYGKGQWATTLRENNGTFYALFIANDQRKTFVYTTQDIQKGPWKRHAVYSRAFHDAGLLFDDGKAYVVWGNGDLRITELEPDLSAIKEGGIDQLLISSPREGWGLRAEGAHFYHIGDYYYVLEIDWPSGRPRTETCWRSKELLGPYESKVVLQGPIGGRGDGVAQGAIVDTPNGDWWAIMFQDHGAVGRIPTLQPVAWVNDWPIMGEGGKPLENFSAALREDMAGNYVWDSDEFDPKPANKLATPQPLLTDGKAFLSPVWQWNHLPIEGMWSLTEREGWLRLRSTTVTDNLMTAQGTLTQRTVGPRCIAEVHLDATGLQPGDRAGLCAFQSNYGTVGVEVDDSGKRFVTAILRRPGFRGMPERLDTLTRVPMPGNEVWLRVRYVFTPQIDNTPNSDSPQDADHAWLAYSFNGTDWTMPTTSLAMRFTLDLFTGYRSALYCYSTAALGGHADFDYFHQWTY